MKKDALKRVQKRILDLVAKNYPQVYLVGGTAISLLHHHRISEDLDFFTQSYSPKLHREIAAFIGKQTHFKYDLVKEEKRKKYVPMATYEFQVAQDSPLKVDFVSDYVNVLQPRQKNGIASIEDIYYRKILAVIGWKAGESATGQALAGGRQKTKDLYDIFF
ncbi:MAG: nucleotidyl transferase AbiEii/AbiGii toxin family protein, partial [Candidatus Omnitrophica bacterium]|nr:nucleotidyl transferase AbiEii/AbiGii toxin family protein [Candidatus Omnitrophota bacterium]